MASVPRSDYRPQDDGDMVFQATSEDDFEALLALRIAAMRPSLEHLGRFDPERARARLRAGFSPEHSWHLCREGVRVGLVTVSTGGDRGDDWSLDHLYLLPAHQGQGLGARVVRQLQQAAQGQGRDVVVSALRDSPANRFYLALGFVLQHQGEFDLDYRWSPART